MLPDHTKLFLTVGIVVLVGCPSVQSMGMIDLLKSILDTLKSIESHVKSDATKISTFGVKQLRPSGDNRLFTPFPLEREATRNRLGNVNNARRSFKTSSDDDDGPVDPIDIQLPSRRELDAERRKNNSPDDSSENGDDLEGSDARRSMRKDSSSEDENEGSEGVEGAVRSFSLPSKRERDSSELDSD